MLRDQRQEREGAVPTKQLKEGEKASAKTVRRPRLQERHGEKQKAGDFKPFVGLARLSAILRGKGRLQVGVGEHHERRHGREQAGTGALSGVGRDHHGPGLRLHPVDLSGGRPLSRPF